MSDLHEGDWVQVWCQVTNPDPHPEDVSVRLESHSDHYVGIVRKDRVEKPEGIPGFATLCTALMEVRVRLDGLGPGDADPIEDGDLALLRCGKHAGHSGKHRHRGLKWADTMTHGYIEEA